MFEVDLLYIWETGIICDHMNWSPVWLVCWPGQQGHPPRDGPGPADGGRHQLRPIAPLQEHLLQLLQALLPVLLPSADPHHPEGEGVGDVVGLGGRVAAGGEKVLISV